MICDDFNLHIGYLPYTHRACLDWICGIDSCIFNLASSKSSFKYISKSGEMYFFALPLVNSIRVDSISLRSFWQLHQQFIQLLQSTCDGTCLLVFYICEGLHHHQAFWAFSFDEEGLVLLMLSRITSL